MLLRARPALAGLRRSTFVAVPRCGYAQAAAAKDAPKKKKGDKPKKGPGDFNVDKIGKALGIDMDKLKPENMEPWVQEEYERVFVKSTGLVVHEPKPAGQEDRKHFKLERRRRIKENNERKTLGILD